VDREIAMSRNSLIWLGLLKVGYAIASVTLLLGAGVKVNRWLRRRFVRDLVVVIGNGLSWAAVQEELNGSGRDYVALDSGASVVSRRFVG